GGALKNRLAVMCISFLALILLFQVWFMGVGVRTPVEFFPDMDPNSAYINLKPPEGADLDYIDRIIRRLEMLTSGAVNPAEANEAAAPYAYEEAYRPKPHQTLSGRTFDGPSDLPNIEYVYAKAVKNESGGALQDNSDNHLGLQFVDFNERVKPTAQTLDEIRERIKLVAGAEITIAKADEGPPTGAPINIEISGDDFRTLGALAADIRDIISRVRFVKDIRDDYVEGIPSVKVHVDRQKAALFGFSTNAIGAVLKTAYNGMDISTYHEGDKDFDITVKLPEEELLSSNVLHKLMIPAADGHLVPLTSIASIEYSGSVGDILRKDHRRVVTVKANVDETKIPGPVARGQAEELLASFPLPPGYEIRFTGENEFQKDSEEFLSRAFIIAIFLIFLILVTLFNSVSQPLIILSSVVLSLGGAFLGLYMLRLPFGIIMSGVGVISLAGVVVNNAIVLIDYTNKLRDRGMPVREAVVAAGATRLRPVLLTAITTILGILPMVTGVSFDFHAMQMSWVSESSQWWRSMAIVVIFGLMIATFLTLIVVPTLYSLLDTTTRRTAAAARWIRELYWKPFKGQVI
ncbi:MAG: efflux RND transporter permease subunit, partial [Desulfobacterales bacterium]|nr:efflux RND transporter permease subunit [Desulfobacterales bacterium]